VCKWYDLSMSEQPQQRPLSALRIFLCHSSGDKEVVRSLYERLLADGFNPWLDEKNILPGQEWELEIRKAVRSSAVVLVCLSRAAINKAGFVQKEIKYALDLADEQPEGAIFIIPVRLEECDVPERLRRWHWVDFYRDQGYTLLRRALATKIPAFDAKKESSPKLYGAVHDLILKKGYQRKFVSLRQPGEDLKYVPVYVDSSGKEVFESEATDPGITIIELPGAEPSRAERERAIDKLTEILFAEPSSIHEKRPIIDPRLREAIKVMAVESDLKLKVGVFLTKKLVADEFYHEFPQVEYAVSFLVESALKEAIVPLTSLLTYETSWDHRGVEDFVEDFARTALRKYVVDNFGFHHEAARAALALHAQLSAKAPYYRDLVKAWGMELLVGLANSDSTERDWARKRMKELEAGGNGPANTRA